MFPPLTFLPLGSMRSEGELGGLELKVVEVGTSLPGAGGKFIKAHVWSRKLKNKAHF